jgi:hypothetical protein
MLSKRPRGSGVSWRRSMLVCGRLRCIVIMQAAFVTYRIPSTPGTPSTWQLVTPRCVRIGAFFFVACLAPFPTCFAALFPCSPPFFGLACVPHVYRLPTCLFPFLVFIARCLAWHAYRMCTAAHLAVSLLAPALCCQLFTRYCARRTPAGL